MKQTAVEWLIEELRGAHVKGDFIFNGVITSELIEQAKEMENKEMAKQQIKDASCPYIGGWEDDEFEHWYNQTFKNSEQ